MELHAAAVIREPFSLDQTFSCGQCFRWKPLERETWRGIAFGRAVTLSLRDGILYADCGQTEFDRLWRPYLDLDRDYASIRRAVSIDPGTAEAAEYGAGIRILRQEPWETLCSFLLSQCNNISRIRGIISRLCAAWGEPLGDGSCVFPAPERIAALSPEELGAVTRCGYRAPYLIGAAQRVTDGTLALGAMESKSTDTLRAQLLELYGVGRKVADCVLLFGFHRLEVFPVDVWMRRAVNALYGRSFDPAAAFGPWAGIAQQYLFFYALNGRLPQPRCQTLHA